MMQRHATFRSSQFESKTAGAHFINERCFGEDLLSWLRGGLTAAGLDASEPIREDYGWGVWLQAGGDPYWLCVGIMDDSIGQEDAEWLLTVAYDPGLNIIKRLFHRPRAADLTRLAKAVHAALTSGVAVRDIRWWPGEPEVGVPSGYP